MNGRRRWIEAMAGGVNFRGSFLLIITPRLAAHIGADIVWYSYKLKRRKDKKKE